ncbi:uncharacterized protein LOC105831554 isoform X2 [Monomorium pharaonis]|uniref:uncharacterized protein LOC105831554 isoform X2 n=1 Tax=Monomorium pharaonis TaxID=307658 RepID=UPI00174681C2|nr:uncharacterized protein LOC105831554 isoform X2 [Monomorium pharaonis]
MKSKEIKINNLLVNLVIQEEIKIKELTSKLVTKKETLHAETQTLEYNNAELSKEKSCLEELEVEKKNLSQEIEQLETECNNLKSSRPNLRDQQLLEQGKKKLKLYKDLMRIQWDYQATRHSIKGYVSNKRDYIHHFCYENQEINNKLIDSLWHEIYLSATTAEMGDENLQSNIPTNVNIMPK